MDKIKVLFVAANPGSSEESELDVEIREITSKIRSADYHDSIDLVSSWAVRPDDLLQLLNQHKPHIVHFSGYGNSSKEITLFDDEGASKPLSDMAIKALFSAMKDNIRVVFLNDCYSKRQAKAITSIVDCAIGIDGAVGHQAAITFASSFYRAIGFGRSIKEAFDQGKTALLLEGFPEENIPELLVRECIDPSSIYLLEADYFGTDSIPSKPAKSSRTKETQLAKLIAIPELPTNFLPRPEDMKTVRDALLTDTSTMAVTGAPSKTGLHGMGGIGKSVLAAAVARNEEIRHHFIDGIFWLTLGTYPKITRSQSDLAWMLDGKPHAFEDSSQGRSVLSSLLAQKKCLIIMDDVWHSGDVQSLLSDLGTKSKMIITTRDARIITTLGASEIRLDLLSELEALKFLANWAGKEVHDLPAESREVVRECGRLPLALAICGAQVMDGVPWTDLLDALKDADLEFIAHEDASVMKSMKSSIDRLPLQDAECYRELVVFPSDETVPEAAIITLWVYANKLKERYARRLISELDRKALIRRMKKDGSNLIELHDLQHDFLRATCGDMLGLQRTLLSAYESKLNGHTWATGPNDGYFFQHLSHHLLKAEKPDELRKLLFDYDWIQTKLRVTDVTSLISDYEFLGSQQDLELVKEAVRLSAHVLIRDRAQLPSQLVGRLKEQSFPQIQTLMEQIYKKVSDSWLRPLSQSLIPPGGPLIRTLQGHVSTVKAIAITPNGKKAVSASGDYSLKVWDLETGQEKWTMWGHSSSVDRVTVTPDGKKAISGSKDNTLIVWNLETGQDTYTFFGHSGRIRAVAITPDGKMAVSGSDDFTLMVWNLETGKKVQTLNGHIDRVLSIAITPSGKKVVSGSADRSIKVWDLETGQELWTLHGHSGPVRVVVITPDGKKAISGSRDCTLKIWDLENGQEIQTLCGHTRPINAIAVFPNGKKAISGSKDKSLKVWDLENGREIRTYLGHVDWITAVAITPDCKKAISASKDNTLRIWDLKTDQHINLVGHAKSVYSVIVTPNGKKAVSGSQDNTLKIWDLEIGGDIPTQHAHTDRIRAIAVTSEGKTAVTASNDNTLKVWDLNTGRYIKTLQGHTAMVRAVAFTHDGKEVISGSRDKTLKVWDLDTGRESWTLRGHEGSLMAVTITPDGKKAVSASRDKSLKVWNLETGQEIRTLQGHTGPVWVVAVTPDGKRVLSGSDDHTLKIWNLDNGQILETLRGHTQPVYALAIDPSGKKIVSGSKDNSLMVWDLQTGQLIKALQGHASLVWVVAITSDGNKILSASKDSSLKLWDLNEGLYIETLRGHTDWVRAAAFISDDKVISSSYDNTLKVWDLQTAKIVAEFTGEGPITAIAVEPNDRTIVAGESTGRIHFLILENPHE